MIVGCRIGKQTRDRQAVGITNLFARQCVNFTLVGRRCRALAQDTRDRAGVDEVGAAYFGGRSLAAGAWLASIAPPARCLRMTINV